MATSLRNKEHGQVLVFVALIIPILLGMAGMAVDVGSYASHRRALQNAADSIALAAARDLPDRTAAMASAQEWATKNGVDPSTMTVTITGVGPGNPNPTVRVSLHRSVAFAFMRIVGIDTGTVNARAAAIKTAPGGMAGVSPWAVLDSVQSAAVPGQLLTLKYDSNNPTNGNFNIIRLDGTGSSTYYDTAIDGSSSLVCASGVSGCSETSPVCTGPACPTETGNKVGDTRNAIDYIMSQTDPHCDTFSEVFSGPVDGRYHLESQCNPWVSGGYPSHRVIVIPVIESLCSGSCSVTIVRFALFWVEGYNGSGCTGNSCELTGRFVNADLTVDGTVGVFDPASPILFVRLTE